MINKIKDLGCVIKGKWNVKMAIFECPYCSKHFEANVSDIKRNRVRHCGCKDLRKSVSIQLPPEINGIKILSDCGLISGRRTATFQCPICTTGTFKAVVSDVKRGVKTHCGCNRKNKAKVCPVKEMELVRKRTVIVLSKAIRKMTSEQNYDLNLLKNRIRCLIRRSLVRNGYTKKSSTYIILGCSMEAFYSHIESQFIDGMGWHNRKLWHIDHIVPLCSASNEQELLSLNHYSNLRPLWAIDNISKGSKIPEVSCISISLTEHHKNYESVKSKSKHIRSINNSQSH